MRMTCLLVQPAAVWAADVSNCHHHSTDVSLCHHYDEGVRWEPDSKGRLQRAALELYGERGYERTTVAEIAERAGVSERTFFRHFADKREVLFAGSTLVKDLLTSTLADAPRTSTPFDAMRRAVGAVGDLFAGRLDDVRRRQSIIAASAELQERELIKLASWTIALAGVLRERGVGEPAASLTAEAGVAVFKVAFERWVVGDDDVRLTELIDASFDELAKVAAG
jgi:AcrR family transcriptional regulator